MLWARASKWIVFWRWTWFKLSNREDGVYFPIFRNGELVCQSSYPGDDLEGSDKLLIEFFGDA